MRDTADFEEEWGDEEVTKLDSIMMSAALMHEPKFTSLAAAMKAEDKLEESKRLTVKFKHGNGKVEDVLMNFKDSYKDEYTCEELPMGHVRLAMQEELA